MGLFFVIQKYKFVSTDQYCKHAERGEIARKYPIHISLNGESNYALAA